MAYPYGLPIQTWIKIFLQIGVFLLDITMAHFSGTLGLNATYAATLAVKKSNVLFLFRICRRYLINVDKFFFHRNIDDTFGQEQIKQK